MTIINNSQRGPMEQMAGIWRMEVVPATRSSDTVITITSPKDSLCISRMAAVPPEATFLIDHYLPSLPALTLPAVVV